MHEFEMGQTRRRERKEEISKHVKSQSLFIYTVVQVRELSGM